MHLGVEGSKDTVHQRIRQKKIVSSAASDDRLLGLLGLFKKKRIRAWEGDGK